MIISYYHDIILSLLPLVVYSWYAMNSAEGAAGCMFYKNTRVNMQIQSHAKEKNVENCAREIGQNCHLLVHLPLIGSTIVATFAGSMFKFYCNLV
jgi:hypothetical protein